MEPERGQSRDLGEHQMLCGLYLGCLSLRSQLIPFSLHHPHTRRPSPLKGLSPHTCAATTPGLSHAFTLAADVPALLPLLGSFLLPKSSWSVRTRLHSIPWTQKMNFIESLYLVNWSHPVCSLGLRCPWSRLCVFQHKPWRMVDSNSHSVTNCWMYCRRMVIERIQMKTKKTCHGKQAECTESGDMERQRKLLESSGQWCQKFSNTHLRHISKMPSEFCA